MIQLRVACAIGLLLVLGKFGAVFSAEALGPVFRDTRSRIDALRATFFREGVASDAIRVEWSTGAESGVVGFDLVYTSLDGRQVKLNSDIIPAEDSLAGGSYSWEGSISTQTGSVGLERSKLALRIWSADGESRLHPVRYADRLAGNAGVSKASTPDTARPSDGLNTGRGSNVRHARLASSAGQVLGFNAFTVAEGVYGISAAELVAASGATAGEISSGLLNHTLAFSAEGNPLAWTLAPGGAGCLIYVPAKRYNYLRGNVIQSLNGVSLEPTVLNAPASDVGASTLGWVEVNVEKDLQAQTGLPGTVEDDVWIWNNFLGSHSTLGKRTYAATLPQIAVNSSACELVIDLASNSDATHIFQATLNTRVVGSRTWSGRELVSWTLPLTATDLLAGVDANQLVMASQGDSTSLCYMNRMRYRYSRFLIVDSGSLVFETPAGGSRKVQAIDGTSVAVWDVTLPGLPVIVNGTVTSPGGISTMAFMSQAGHRYVAFRPSAPLGVSRWQTVTGNSLKTGTLAVDYLVVTPDEWVVPANRLAALRTGQGLRSQVVCLSQLRHEFSNGAPRPDALKDLLTYARANWIAAPKYVVLLGDGTYDYLGFLATPVGRLPDNLQPPPMIMTLFGRAAADWLMLDSQSAPTALGRLPAKSVSELDAMIDRIIAFEGTPPPVGDPVALLVADYPDVAAGDFVANSEELAAIAGSSFAIHKNYNTTGTSGNAAVRALLQTELAAGVTWMNYVGHGGRDRIGTDYMLMTDVPTQSFGSVSPLVSGMTCVMGQFAVPGADCLAEALVNKSGVGPIGVWSPSGFSLDFQAKDLNQAFAEELKVARGLDRLGDIVRRSRSRYLQAGGDTITPEFYNFLGDPALKLPFLPSTIEGRWVFYNNSFFDGGSTAAGVQDDSSIAPNKTALLPGGLATFANYTSYRRGLNGIMVDVANLPPGTPTLSDFDFKAGNVQGPGTWADAPTPITVTVRRSAGVGGSDRITLIWNDNNLDLVEDAHEAVAKRWLQITVKATAGTGLSASDTFYFGNAVGETGNSLLDVKVTSSDALRVLNNVSILPNLSSPFDINRDGKVTTADYLLVLNNVSAIQPMILLDLRPALALAGGAPLKTLPAMPTRITWEGDGLRLGLNADVAGRPIEVWRAPSVDSEVWERMDVVPAKNPYTGQWEFRFPADPEQKQSFYRLKVDLSR